MNKIKKIVDLAIVQGEILANQTIEYFDYQPDEGFINADNVDGAVAVYASEITFDPSAGTKTANQDDDSFIVVDCYGFGDPVEDSVDIDTYRPTAREAQIRGETLITLAYQAIMDRREIQGSPSEGIPKMFGSGVKVAADKYPVSLKKSETIGTMESKRGVVIYRLIIKFRVQEVALTEALGELYAGADNLTSEVTDPDTISE